MLLLLLLVIGLLLILLILLILLSLLSLLWFIKQILRLLRNLKNRMLLLFLQFQTILFNRKSNTRKGILSLRTLLRVSLLFIDVNISHWKNRVVDFTITGLTDVLKFGVEKGTLLRREFWRLFMLNLSRNGGKISVALVMSTDRFLGLLLLRKIAEM